MAKSIKLSEKEVEMLVENYQFELEQALEYIKEIRNLLAKLGATSKSTDEKPEEKKEKKKTKRGRKKRVVEVDVAVTPVPEVKPEPVKVEKPVAPRAKKEKTEKRKVAPAKTTKTRKRSVKPASTPPPADSTPAEVMN